MDIFLCVSPGMATYTLGEQELDFRMVIAPPRDKAEDSGMGPGAGQLVRWRLGGYYRIVSSPKFL